MHSLNSAKLAALLLLVVHVFAQETTQSVQEVLARIFVNPYTGLLKFLMITQDPILLPSPAIKTFLGDIATFYTSYTEADTFNFTAAKEQALTSASINSVDIVTALQSMEDTYTFEFETGLLGGPDSFMSALRNVASPFPFSTDVLSQATGLFRGYMSLVSVKLLDARNIQPVTPVLRTTATSNMNATSTTATRGTAAVAGAVATITQAKLTVTATATTTDNNNADTAGAPPPSTATATAMGIRTAPRNPKLMIIAAVGAAAAAASMFGIMINAL